MKKIKAMLLMLMALFAISAQAEKVGYRFPTDGNFTNASDGYYKTWVSSDGVLKIEGDSNWSFYRSSSTSNWTYIYKANYTMSVTSGSTILEYALASPHGGKEDVTFTPEKGTASSIPTWDSEQKNYGSNIEVKDINASSTTFTVNGEGEYAYFSVYTDYFVITVDKGDSGNTGGGEGPTMETKKYTFATDGTFSDATTYEGYEYYKTWTSSDGNLTITGDDNYNFMKSGGWYYLLEGKFTVTAKGQLKNIKIGYPSGSNSEGGTFTDSEGSTITIPANADGQTYGSNISLTDINAPSTTFTITGSFSICNEYMTIEAEIGGGEGPGPGGDPNQAQEYKFCSGGTFTGEYDYEGFKYYTGWTSSDGNITIANATEGEYAFAAAGNDWYYLLEGTFSITSRGQLQSYSIYYPIGSTEKGGTFTDAAGNSYTIPQYASGTYGPNFTVSDINAPSTTFTVSGDVAIANGYLTITATGAGGGGGQGPGPDQGGGQGPGPDQKQQKEISFSSDGTFSDATAAPDGSSYYKTWTSSDGSITITGPNEYSFYGPESDHIITLEPGQYTVTVSGEQTTLASYELQYASGIEAAATFTDGNGTTYNLAANADRKTWSGEAISVQNINATTTTFTVGGSGMYIYDDYAKFTIETAGGGQGPDQGGGQGGDDDTQYIKYQLSQGTFKTPFVDAAGKEFAGYSSSWTSNDGVVTLKSTKPMSNGEPAWIFQISNGTPYMRANDSQYQVEVAEGYQFRYLQVSYPVSWYAETTLKFGTTEWVLPINTSDQGNTRYYPDPYYMNIDQPSFVISGATNARIWADDGSFIFYLTKGEDTGIRTTVADSPGKNVIYDLQGRRVLAPQKGIYIVNGKKVIIR